MPRLLDKIRKWLFEDKMAPAEYSACTHQAMIKEVTPSSEVCEECIAKGDTWVHLRICMTCGHVGCCDNSKNMHASAHYMKTGHAIMKSFQPGENWMWCYIDRVFVRK